ncbi:MAG TPA: hypothetical protein EYP30_00055, partial [Archaeoglobaceae archaeon]|nr:hypothetical protein [Archaeoglobaceae archaeon]
EQTQTPNPTPNPAPEPTQTPTPEQTPEQTPKPTPEQTPALTPAPAHADIQHASIEIKKDGIYYADVRLVLPNPCYEIIWGSTETNGSEFLGNARISKLSDQCIQVLTEFNHSYPLGDLKPGKYRFTFSVSGKEIKSLEFSVPEKLKLSVSIEPKSTRAKPGDLLTYTLTLNWEPEEWRGAVNLSLILSASGFEKKYELYKIKINSNPPMKRQISFEIPEDLPPMTYDVRFVAHADSVTATEKTTLKVLPGFEIIIFILAILVALRLMR